MKKLYTLLFLIFLLPHHTYAQSGKQSRSGVTDRGQNYYVTVQIYDNPNTGAINPVSGVLSTPGGEKEITAQQHRNPYIPGVYAGSVTVAPISLREEGDSLNLTMNVLITGETMNRRQSWSIIPVLSGTEGTNTSLELPYILINGRIKEQHYKRKQRFGNLHLASNPPAIKVDVPHKKNTVLSYSVRVPYEEWMDFGALNIYQVLTSSAEKQQLFTIEHTANVELESREPYHADMRINFVVPEKEKKQRKMQGQAFLDFQVGRSAILPNFRRNAEELTKISEAVRKVQINPDVNIVGLFIEGYASPEGSYATNERLARERSYALRDYMVGTYNLNSSLFRVNSVAEDWDGLRILVQESDIAQKDNILGIIDSNDTPDRKEQRLRALGTPWRIMLNEMFPQLRRVDYQIDFTVRDYSVEESRHLASRDPEMLSHRELFLLASSYPDGSEERQNIFDIILRLYPEDPAALINHAAQMLRRGEVSGAKRYLERAGDDNRTWNNLGVYYLQAGELDRAEEYFKRAASQGMEEAAHNLKELEKKREDNIKMERYNIRK